MEKEKLKAYSVGLQPSLLKKIKESAIKNSDGNSNFEIRRLIKKALKDEGSN